MPRLEVKETEPRQKHYLSLTQDKLDAAGKKKKGIFSIIHSVLIRKFGTKSLIFLADCERT